MFIEAELFWKLLHPEQITLGLNKPVLQNTKLGWVIGGEYIQQQNSRKATCNFIESSDVQKQLREF